MSNHIQSLSLSGRAASGTIDELTSQHTQLHDMGEAMVRGLDDVVNGSVTSRERIEATARAFVAGLRLGTTSRREITMQYTLMLWHVDHFNFGRLLNLLECELQRLLDRDTALRSERHQRVDGIDSIAIGHWIIEFRRPIFRSPAKEVGRRRHTTRIPAQCRC